METINPSYCVHTVEYILCAYDGHCLYLVFVIIGMSCYRTRISFWCPQACCGECWGAVLWVAPSAQIVHESSRNPPREWCQKVALLSLKRVQLAALSVPRPFCIHPLPRTASAQRGAKQEWGLHSPVGSWPRSCKMGRSSLFLLASCAPKQRLPWIWQTDDQFDVWPCFKNLFQILQTSIFKLKVGT